jgi:uncharacterized RDD family membrane protein YckC
VQPIDQLNIDTPEQIALEFPMAGIGSRFLAIVVDTLIQAGLYLAVFLLFILGSSLNLNSFLSGIPSSVTLAITIFLVFCLYWGYYAFFETLWKGQTPGKRAAGIRVIKNSGRPVSIYESLARNLMRAVDWLPGLYVVGISAMLLDKQNRRLGDLVAGTVVVHEQRAADVRPTWAASVTANAVADEVADARLTGITAEELLLIETYLDRRWQLGPEIQARTRQQITRRIVARTGVEPPLDQSLDHFLEMVARQVRNQARYR